MIFARPLWYSPWQTNVWSSYRSVSRSVLLLLETPSLTSCHANGSFRNSSRFFIVSPRQEWEQRDNPIQFWRLGSDRCCPHVLQGRTPTARRGIRGPRHPP